MQNQDNFTSINNDDAFFGNMIELIKPEYLFPKTDEEKEELYNESVRRRREKLEMKRSGRKDFNKKETTKVERVLNLLLNYKSNAQIIAEREGYTANSNQASSSTTQSQSSSSKDNKKNVNHPINSQSSNDSDMEIEKQDNTISTSSSNNNNSNNNNNSSNNNDDDNMLSIREQLRKRLAKKLEILKLSRKAKVENQKAEKEKKKQEKKGNSNTNNNSNNNNSNENENDNNKRDRRDRSSSQDSLSLATPLNKRLKMAKNNSNKAENDNQMERDDNQNENSKKLQAKLSTLSFNKLTFGKHEKSDTMSELIGQAKKSKVTPYDKYAPKQSNKKALQIVQNKQKKIEEIKGSGDQEAIEKEKWASIERHAKGETTLNDLAHKLKKKIKLKEKKKKKSIAEWSERLAKVKEGKESRIASREENIAKRKEQIIHKRLKNKGIEVPESAKTSENNDEGKKSSRPKSREDRLIASGKMDPKERANGKDKHENNNNNNKSQNPSKNRKGFEGKHKGYLNKKLS